MKALHPLYLFDRGRLNRVRESFERTTESDRPVPRKKEFSLKAGLERKVGFSLNNEVKGLTLMFFRAYLKDSLY